MLRSAATLVLLLTASCSVSSPIPPSPGDASGYFPLSASDVTRAGTWVRLEEDAYVAVFNVQHERGAVLVWPYSEESPRMLPAGQTDLPPRSIEEQRLWGRRRSYLFPGVDMGPRSIQQTGLMLFVASSQPLLIDAYLEDPRALKDDLGADFTDQNGAVNRIVELVVSNPQGHNWAWTCTGTPMWCNGR